MLNVKRICKMDSYILSFEHGNNSDEIIIHGDEKGLIKLQETIQRLIETTNNGQFNHDHLMTPAWSGHELSERNMGARLSTM